MAILRQTKILNVIPGTTPQLTVHCSQDDAGSEVAFDLYAGSAPFEPQDAAISVQGIRKDGTGFGPEACTYDGNTVTVTLSTEMTGVAGPAVCELTITETSGSVSTANFALLVEAAAFPHGPIVDDSVDVYQQILTYVQTFAASAAADATAKVAAEAALRQAADQALQTSITANTSAISAETAARSSADSLLQTEIDQIIAPTGEAPSEAEVENARIGADGTVYDTLGNAIRGQVGDLKSALKKYEGFKGYVTANSDLNNFQETGIYLINLSAEDFATVLNKPSTSMLPYSIGLFLTVIHTKTVNNTGMIIQRISGKFADFSNTNGCISRYGNLSGDTFTWGNWVVEFYSAKGTDTKINASFEKTFAYKGFVSPNTDFNDYQMTGIYQLNLTAEDYATVQNRPSTSLLSSPTSCFLEVIHTSTVVNDGIVYQKIINGFRLSTQKYNTVARYGVLTNGTFVWGSWAAECYSVTGANGEISKMSGGAIEFGMDTSAIINYKANAGEKFAFIIADADFDYTGGNTNIYFEGYKNGASVGYPKVLANPSSSDIGKMIVFTLPYDVDMLRLGTNKSSSTVITKFEGIIRIQQPYTAVEMSQLNAPHIFRVGANREYTSLLEGIIAAEQYKNSIVYVDPGVYDAVQEFKDKYGSDYFTRSNYTSQPNFRGIPLKNGVHVIGYSGVVITGGLESTDSASAIEWWSIFNAGDDAGGTNGYGFTLENITIKVLNQYLRYAVHDEYGGVDFDYTNKYLNCHWEIASEVDKACIGGGLGKHGYIVIDNCTVDAPAYLPTRAGIHYHNNVDAGSLSKIYISNCYIPNGTVGMSWYGNTPATEKSIMYVNNCTLQYAPIKHAESSEYTNENADIVAWRNTHLT